MTIQNVSFILRYVKLYRLTKKVFVCIQQCKAGYVQTSQTNKDCLNPNAICSYCHVPIKLWGRYSSPVGCNKKKCIDAMLNFFKKTICHVFASDQFINLL